MIFSIYGCQNGSNDQILCGGNIQLENAIKSAKMCFDNPEYVEGFDDVFHYMLIKNSDGEVVHRINDEDDEYIQECEANQRKWN